MYEAFVPVIFIGLASVPLTVFPLDVIELDSRVIPVTVAEEAVIAREAASEDEEIASPVRVRFLHFLLKS